jgi:DNA-binding winged helix-turn-helix (wHTH) protein
LRRYRFGEFTLSPRQRLLLSGDRELRLIPRYLDLLIFLVERRHEAVHRREIFDRVWTDVIVSDAALAQAIRTLRRTLGDDPKQPRFIRTISRHGYQFVFDDLIEEPDEGRAPSSPVTSGEHLDAADAFEPLLQRLTTPATSAAEEADQRDAAERLHQLGTREAIARLGTRPGHAYARAVLRDTRWDVPEADAVPIVGEQGAVDVARALIRMRLGRAARLAAGRAVAASLGGGASGAIAGGVGGLLLSSAPGSRAPVAIAVVLAAIGAACGAWGGACVGVGISLAEAALRSRRVPGVVAGAAVGGGIAGVVAQWLGRAALSTLVGVHVPIGGTFEGIAIGAAAGLGLALSTRSGNGGFAAPRGRRRLTTAVVTGALCALAALALAASGAALVGGTIHAVAQASNGSEAALTPLGRMLGETEFGTLTRALVGTGEGAMFGIGLALGLTRRPHD